MPSLIHLPQHQVLGPQLSTMPIGTSTPAQTGIWECQPGGWPVSDRPTTGTSYIISGRDRLTDSESGITTEIFAGDFVVLPPGWSGRWDVTETLRKAYSIF